MSTPRHRTAPGRTYFVSTRTAQGRALFQVDEVACIVVESILEYRNLGKYALHEFVLMPNHLHLLLTAAGDTTIEKGVRLIKGGSSYRIHRRRGHSMEIWQPGFHEWTIRDADDYKTKCAYIRNNPVKAGLIQRAEDWIFGSASGKYPLDLVPQGLKPPGISKAWAVGAKAPTS